MSPLVQRSARLAAAAALAAVALWAPAAAHAQYFGQNKVQYRTFDFRVLRSPHFDIYFYPEEEAASRDAARMAERWYARYSRILDHEFEARQPVILYASSPEFQQTSALQGDIGEGTGGVTEVFKQRVILPFAGPYAETDHVLGHELVHAFQYDISGLGRAGGGLEQAAQRFNAPLWFIEGMAEYLSLGPVDPNTSMWLRDAALTNTLPNQAQLTYDPRFFPYRWGQALWAYIGGRWGDAAIGQILKQVGQGVPYQDAFTRILNSDLDQIIKDWHDSIRRTYLPLLTTQREAREIATPLVTTNLSHRGGYNVAPSVSPDGRQFIFLSQQNFIDIQLYLGDAQTGHVERRLVKGTALDPHFGSLRFISSSGAWSPDQQRFAFSALRKAHDVVVLLDIQSARILREYTIPGVGEISNPTFSADGNTIVVSGMKGGLSDLYAIDLNSGATRQLTNDKVAQLHPDFSPDGRTLAFTTDAGTDVNQLTWGNYRIALMDWATGQVRLLPGTETGRNINPQWARDGAGLYFVSDRTGIPNIYRSDVNTGALTQVTNLFTGVSGITTVSPAISSATHADRVVFTVYEHNGYNIYAIANPAQLAGVAPQTPQLAANGEPLPELLPPSPRPAEPAYNRVYALIHDPAYGRPDPSAPSTYAVAPYRSRLTLDYLGQPTVGVGAASGAYGQGGVYGGVGGIFSDMLGYHTIYGTVQAQGQVDEIGFNVVYLNQQHRVNWGASVARSPYIVGGYAQGLDQSGNLHNQLVVYRYFDNSAYGIAQYPFSRVQRLEFAAGARRITQDVHIQDWTYAPTGGGGYAGPISYDEQKQSLGSWNLGEGSAALVYDNAIDGYTSPIVGQRYRFEEAPTIGDLKFNTLTADYRRYVLVRSLTLAFRGLHFGRYGRDEAVPSAIFLGYPFLVRGYSYNSVSDECLNELQTSANGGKACQVYQMLFGSRVAVGNLELRIPVIRNTLHGNVQLPPVEVFGFLDAGAAWGKIVTDNAGNTTATHLRFAFGPQTDPLQRGFLTSGGVGTRINLFGYLIGEIDFVNSFDRPNHWHWQFSFQPGF
jgi:Tol biopolymer transport system component